jgi:hypothetical protein
MELALNLAWVCVTLSGFALLKSSLSRASGCSARQPSRWQKIMAMSCALIILFFVISMTDDLHDQQMAVEESRSLQVTAEKASPLRASPHPVVTPSFLLFFAPARYCFSLSAAEKLRRPTEASFASSISRRSLCGRAPPTSLA